MNNTAFNEVGMALCVAGRRDMLINGALYHIERGVMVVKSPIINTVELWRSPDFRVITIYDSIEVFYPFASTMFDIIVDILNRSPLCLQLSEKQIERFVETVEELKERRLRIKVTTDERERRLLENLVRVTEQHNMLEFLNLFFNDGKVRPVKTSRDEALAFRFVYHVNLTGARERSVDHYAALENITPNYFTRVVKRATGKTPSQWIVQITIAKAKTMINEKKLTIKEIARELNFPEQFTFRKYFKHYAGVSPTEYRRISGRGKG